MVFRKVSLFVVGLLASLSQAQQLSVPISIPVTIPFTVQPGQSFEVAAQSFCERNGLSLAEVPRLTEALNFEWEGMQKRNQIARCFKWQRKYAVAPMKSWGRMPDDMRIQWLDMNCDNVVPMEPPTPHATVQVKILDTLVPLDYYEGDDMEEIVVEFCEGHGIPPQEYKQILIEAVQTAVSNAKDKSAQIQQEEQQQQQQQQEQTIPAPKRGTFLFSLPVQINGQETHLDVHEGDQMGPLVKNFCATHGISYEEYGETFKKTIMKTLVDLQRSLLDEINGDMQATQDKLSQAMDPEQKKGEREADTRPVVLSVPITVDGQAVNLELREGDSLGERVSAFCKQHGIPEEEVGAPLRNAVLERYKQYQKVQQERQVEKEASALG